MQAVRSKSVNQGNAGRSQMLSNDRVDGIIGVKVVIAQSGKEF